MLTYSTLPPKNITLNGSSKHSKSAPSPSTMKLLACPFWKANSHRHVSCFPLILSRIRDVKQHLRRCHYSPFSCTRCAAPFSSESAPHQHVFNPNGLFCTPLSSSSPAYQLGRISSEQMVGMGRRSNSKLPEEDQWFLLWDAVFPGHPRPRSAYREGCVSEELSSFREFCARDSEEVLDGATQDVMATGEWPGFARLEGDERRSILR